MSVIGLLLGFLGAVAGIVVSAVGAIFGAVVSLAAGALSLAPFVLLVLFLALLFTPPATSSGTTLGPRGH